VRDLLPDGPASAPGSAPIRLALATQHLAAALALDAGDLVAARSWLDAAERWLAWSGAVRWQAEQSLLQARYHHAAGQLERARQTAAEALNIAAAPRQPLALLGAYRLLGEFATEARQYEAAAGHLGAALGLADDCAIPYERALTLLSLAELAAATRARSDADARLALARANALAAHTAASSAYPGGMTAREVAVLRLVAEGLTNAQVAERLFLSPGTIHAHLSSIYGKLGVGSRAAATRFALEQHLV
jgi:DNA-binding CsgD family transcriptional regulator